MKTLILFESKMGYTKGCADYLNENIEDSVIFDVKSREYNLMDYDTILIGAPIYQGKIEKKTSRLLKIHKIKLLKRKLGIFCAGMNQSEFNFAVQESLPPDIFYHAEIVHCGGKIELKKLTIKEKLIIRRKLGIKKSEEVNHTGSMKKFLEWAKK